MNEEKMVFPEDTESAKLVTATFWKSRDGVYYQQNAEQSARWAGATHVHCNWCGGPAKKGWLACESCRAKLQAKNYAKLPVVDWDEETPLCLYKDDRYFYSMDDVMDYCEEYEIDPESLQFVLCKRVGPPQVDVSSLFEDHLADEQDDSDIPGEVWKAAEEFNKVLSAYAPELWTEGDKAVRIAK